VVVDISKRVLPLRRHRARRAMQQLYDVCSPFLTFVMR